MKTEIDFHVATSPRLPELKHGLQKKIAYPPVLI